MADKERDRREKFIELCEKRVEKAENALKLVGNLGNKGLYDSTEAERKQMISHLKKSLREMESSLNREQKKKKDGFKLKRTK
tara:strand:- start:1071 stop:1316 length:246 start_codon:yes stop_codon:yes gene_type:complete